MSKKKKKRHKPRKKSADGQYVFMTNSLKLLLARHRETMHPLRYNLMVQQVFDRIEFYKRELLKEPPGIQRAGVALHTMHRILEREKETHPKDFASISCQRGCSGCCHQWVMATPDEARMLAEFIANGDIKVDRALLERQAAHVGDESTWWRLPKSENKCVFLQPDLTCGVYEMRPLSCRKYLVTSPPSQCAELVNQEVTTLAYFEAEILASAAADIDRNMLNMPAIIWKILNEIETKDEDQDTSQPQSG